jgi:hypothetical protein
LEFLSTCCIVGRLRNINVKGHRHTMKSSLRLSTLILLAFFLFGCNWVVSPTNSSNSIPLEIDNQKVLLEFIQNNSSVPCSNDKGLWKVSLNPEPFTLMVHGNKDLVSVTALKSIDMAVPLQNISKPLVTFSGTSNGFWEHSLYLHDPSIKNIEIYDSPSFFQKYWSEPDETLAYLKNKLGTEPVIITSSRTYLGGEPSYSISNISNNDAENFIQSGNSMVLVVFIEKDLGEDFQQLNWVIFNLEFK